MHMVIWWNDINSNGMWVDRYYNPTNISHYQALNNPSDGLITNYSEISSNTGLDYITYDIYDVKSNLTFETGALYAYHHIGNSNCQSFVNRLSSNYILIILIVILINSITIMHSQVQLNLIIIILQRYHIHHY
jgi:hypothetical protein